MMLERKKIALEERYCPCCNNNDLEKLWSYTFPAKTKKAIWEFNVCNVICRKCGFVFVSPAAIEKDLKDYYFDSYTPYDKQTLDYDINKRIEFIKRNLSHREVYIEIGSNRQSIFHKKLKDIFSKVITVEINNNVARDLQSIEEIYDNNGDVLTHYFVLEHVTNIENYFYNCHRALKAGGIMICEVPDIEFYPQYLSPFMLHEHVNHFSLGLLTRIAENCGFNLIDSSYELCSRPYGVAVAFIKHDRQMASANSIQLNETLTSKISTNYDNKNFFSPILRKAEVGELPGEYEKNKSFFTKALEKMNKFDAQIDNANFLLTEYAKKNMPIILWGANDNLIRFLSKRNSMPKNVFIVDSNPEKKNFFLDDLPVFLPNEVKQEIINSVFIIIFTRLHSNVILEYIKNEYDKLFNNQDLLILDI
ncbi:MAG: methyltransferase domain-containing protein [Proteobacteria bacterium]|nr:methyltransferase domain-containing protein [Pseudomonadota bacterium]